MHRHPLHALTILQPWASLIALGHKPVENRTWTPPATLVGRHLAIHAGVFSGARGGSEDQWGAALELATERGIVDSVPLLADFLRVVDDPDRGRLYRQRCKHHIERAVPYGAIVAVAVIEDVIRASESRPHPLRESPWFVGPNGWVLSDVVRLPEPVPCRGQQGLWLPEPRVVDAVREGYRAATRAQG